MPITIYCPHPECDNQCLVLAKKLHLEIESEKSTGVQLLFVADQLQLIDNSQKQSVIVIDFLSRQMDYRCRHGGGLKQDLARAIGIKSHTKPSVIDATCGLARDAYIIARLGCRVVALERHPVVSALIENALERLARQGTIWNDIQLQFQQVDSLAYLKQLKSDQIPDVIYLDPMFPMRKKTALVKKEMRILKQLVGHDVDADMLFKQSLKTAKKRVVVKRPRISEPLGEQEPNHTIVGKSNRFDIYYKF